MPQTAMLDLGLDIGGTMTEKGPLQDSTKDEKRYAWVVAFTHQASCEIDPKTGLPRTEGAIGKKPVVALSEFIITKKLDYTTPLLHAAYKDGKELTTWKLNLWQIPMSGGANNYFTIQLTGAKITSIRTIKPPMFAGTMGAAHELEEIAFTYDKIRFDALPAPRGLSFGSAPADSHSYSAPIAPHWEEEKARAFVQKMAGMLKERISGEVKDKLIKEGILTKEGLPGENYPK